MVDDITVVVREDVSLHTVIADGFVATDPDDAPHDIVNYRIDGKCSSKLVFQMCKKSTNIGTYYYGWLRFLLQRQVQMRSHSQSTLSRVLLPFNHFWILNFSNNMF